MRKAKPRRIQVGVILGAHRMVEIRLSRSIFMHGSGGGAKISYLYELYGGLFKSLSQSLLPYEPLSTAARSLSFAELWQPQKEGNWKQQSACALKKAPLPSTIAKATAKTSILLISIPCLSSKILNNNYPKCCNHLLPQCYNSVTKKI
jgi:hypothetical protein